MDTRVTASNLSRRGFLGLAGVAAGSSVLAACGKSNSGGGSGGDLKFWNMPWGNTEFNKVDKKITLAYQPPKGMPGTSYQVVQWSNYVQAFASAVASKTGPAVSSGGGTQAFRFAAQGAIAYADHLLDSWKKNGLYDDFLPGLIDTMKVKAGYAAVPYNLDMRVMWYSPQLLDKAGASVPTDWQSYLDACAKLKKIGVYGYGTGAGSGNHTGGHVLDCWMINNGGGLFDANQQPNCVTPANITAIEFVLEMVKKGYVDPACPTYTSANVQTQWKDKKFGMGFDTAGLAENVGGAVGSALKVGNPLVGPTGKKGALYFPNNIMMYKNTPSQDDSEAFLTYYYKNMKPLWTKKTGIGLPPLKSITETKEFQSDANNIEVIKEWQPISRTWAAPGGNGLFYNVTAVDGTTVMDDFAQLVLGGKTTAKAALTKLQNEIQANVKKLK